MAIVTRLNSEEQRAIRIGCERYGLPGSVALALWHSSVELSIDDKGGREGEPPDAWDVFAHLCRNEMEG